MLTNNILQRVFRLSVNNRSGSAYTIEKDGQQYLVSASHIFEGQTEVNEVLIYHGKRWKPYNVQIVFNSPKKDADTIIFRLNEPISPTHDVTYNLAGAITGTWCYLLGFPFGFSNGAEEINENYPIPFIKAALLSALDGDSHGFVKLYLDGHNNKGFSGGPVVWIPPGTKNMQVIGTISGFHKEAPHSDATDEECDLFAVNSGIVIAHWLPNLFDYLL